VGNSKIAVQGLFNKQKYTIMKKQFRLGGLENAVSPVFDKKSSSAVLSILFLIIL
jgi:hypothetical protein